MGEGKLKNPRAAIQLTLFTLSLSAFAGPSIAWADVKAPTTPTADARHSSPQPSAGSNAGSPINPLTGESLDEEAQEVEHARQTLESRYRNPADVALPPKLLVPHRTQTTQASGSKSLFDIYQLKHIGHLADPTSPVNAELSLLQKQTANIKVVPVNIANAEISDSTPAQEFFNQASMLSLGLGGFAIALTGFVVLRGKRRELAHG
jgi:hypothetical protein